VKPLMPIEAALEQVLASVRPLSEDQEIPLSDALGRVLAEDIRSSIDVPGSDNSAMDGYALRASESSMPLKVTQRIPAGSIPEPLESGTAARIFTGATTPEGADAVVMQENCSEEEGTLKLDKPVSVGENIRPRGQDVNKSEVVLEGGRRLRPQDLGLLASVGVARVPVLRPLKVAILSTGDELIEPGESAPAAGQLYNSNRYTLLGLLKSMGIECLDFGIVPDDPAETGARLEQAAAAADCVISSGGVSVGEEDHVKAQVERLGELALWKLAIKPGKPLAFGNIAGTPFFGLPGNPTSVFVTFSLVARPYLLAQQGVKDVEFPKLNARAKFEVTRAGARQDYLRVQVRNIDGTLYAEKFSNQSSGVLSSVSRSNGLAIVPIGKTIAEGDPVEIILLDGLY
jgi:molybdopterin molybdotransferase